MERRDRIIGAAKAVFLKEGYFKTNIRDIALAAELSPGAIYYYFGGIDEIHAEICVESFDLINEFLERESRRVVSPRRKLENMARA
ncbi:MAG: helix-turn-helix domain-containing protein [Candidatus Binatia bacterium]|jgi:AcrR family transcriptional regulator